MSNEEGDAPKSCQKYFAIQSLVPVARWRMHPTPSQDDRPESRAIIQSPSNTCRSPQSSTSVHPFHPTSSSSIQYQQHYACMQPLGSGCCPAITLPRVSRVPANTMPLYFVASGGQKDGDCPLSHIAPK